MGSFMEENSNYPDDTQFIYKKSSFSEIVYTNESEKCKANKTFKNLETKSKSNDARLLRFPIYLELKWNKRVPYTTSNDNVKYVRSTENIDELSVDSQEANDLNVRWSNSFWNNLVNNLVNVNYDYVDFINNRAFDLLGPPLVRNAAGGGPTFCSKSKKNSRQCDPNCVYDNKPFNFRKKSKTCGIFSSKKSTIKNQRSDICCSNYIDVAVEPVKQDRKCALDKCAKCKKRSSAGNVSKDYFSECFKDPGQSQAPCALAFLEKNSKINCDCQKKLELLAKMTDPQAPQPAEVPDAPDPAAPTVGQTDSGTAFSMDQFKNQCELCCTSQATETFRIKKGKGSAASIRVCKDCSKKVDMTLLKQKSSKSTRTTKSTTKSMTKTTKKDKDKGSSCLGLCASGDKMQKSSSKRSVAGGKNIDCKTGSCVANCGKSRSTTSVKPSKVKTKKSTTSIKSTKSKQKSSPLRACCPNCNKTSSGSPTEAKTTTSRTSVSKTSGKSKSGSSLNKSPSKNKFKQYCCNYSKNKDLKSKKKKSDRSIKRKKSSVLGLDVCDNVKCKKRQKLQGDGAKAADVEQQKRSLCECPKGCKCLCSKYSFFEPKLLPIEDKTDDGGGGTIQQKTTMVTTSSVVTNYEQSADCEDPEVGQVIEDLKSEMNSLMKKLDKLGRSQCKCTMKTKSDVVLFAQQYVNNPFHPKNKLKQYIQINDEPLLQISDNMDGKKGENMFDLKSDKLQNMMFILPPCHNLVNEYGPCSMEFISNTNLQSEEPSVTKFKESDASYDDDTHICKGLSETEITKSFDNDEDESKAFGKSKKSECSNKDKFIENKTDKIEIISTRLEKDPSTNKQKILLHLHIKKDKDQSN